MRSSAFGGVLLAASLCLAATPAEELYSALERRLQALNSLEIRYEAETDAGQGRQIEGRLLWVKPDHFLHVTPEWSLCEVGAEQWRYLKAENTLIREDVRDDQSEWLPDEVLFNLRKSFRARSLDDTDADRRILHLQPADATVSVDAALEFPKGASRPDALEFASPDGQSVRYRILSWRENVSVDSSVFSPPDVPAENVMDFRGAGQSR